MLIERPPIFYRLLFPEAIWRIKHRRRKVVFLTFDDGPIPEVTPWVLDTLDRYGIKATFFMVGDNVRRHPELLEEVRRRGHAVGNHTMHHLQGMKVTAYRYMHDISEANDLIDSPLFRPPHGLLRWKQARAIKDRYRKMAGKEQVIRDVNALIETMAARKGITFINLYPLFCDEEGNLRRDLTNDGLHLLGPGYLIWREAVLPYVNE